jgi:predicted Zn-dependent protease
MATLRKRGERWQVQVRRQGRADVSRSFLLKSDALAWARQQELEADRHGIPTARKALAGVTVADVVRRYRDEVLPRKWSQNSSADRCTIHKP